MYYSAENIQAVMMSWTSLETPRIFVINRLFSQEKCGNQIFLLVFYRISTPTHVLLHYKTQVGIFYFLNTDYKTLLKFQKIHANICSCDFRIYLPKTL